MSRALMLVLRAIFVTQTVPFRCLNTSLTRPFFDAHENDSQLWRRLRWLTTFSTFVWLLGEPQHGFCDPRGDELIARYLKDSVRREAILTMHVDYHEPQKEGLRLEFTWMRRVRDLTSHLIRLGSRHLPNRARCFSSMRSQMGLLSTWPTVRTAYLRRRFVSLELAITNTKV